MTRSVCAMLVALVAAGCGRAKAPDETVESDAPVLVHVAKAGPATVSVEVKAPGTTVSAPGAEIVITAPMQGRVAALPHGEGDRVKAGDLLVQFEIPSLAADLATRQSALAQAKARVANAQAARDRLAGLLCPRHRGSQGSRRRRARSRRGRRPACRKPPRASRPPVSSRRASASRRPSTASSCGGSTIPATSWTPARRIRS